MERLGRILASLRLKAPGPLESRQLEEAVRETFSQEAPSPPSAGPDVRVSSYRKGCLILEVRSAAQAFEYRAFHQQRLLQALKGCAGLEQLSELRFRVGSWRQDDE